VCHILFGSPQNKRQEMTMIVGRITRRWPSCVVAKPTTTTTTTRRVLSTISTAVATAAATTRDSRVWMKKLKEPLLPKDIVVPFDLSFLAVMGPNLKWQVVYVKEGACQQLDTKPMESNVRICSLEIPSLGRTFTVII
jgi:hypothetical protein